MRELVNPPAAQFDMNTPHSQLRDRGDGDLVIDLVIAAYRENTSWITPMTHGIPNLRIQLFCKSHDLEDPRCQYLPNIGQDHYVTLKYIIDNYDRLPDVMVVTHNSILRGEWNWLLKRKLEYVLDDMQNTSSQLNFVRNVGFKAMSHTRPGLYLPWNDQFHIDHYRRGSGSKARPLCLSNTRPIGRWYRKYVDPRMNRTHMRRVGVSYNDIYAVSRERVLWYTKSIYQSLLD